MLFFQPSDQTIDIIYQLHNPFALDYFCYSTYLNLEFIFTVREDIADNFPLCFKIEKKIQLFKPWAWDNFK